MGTSAAASSSIDWFSEHAPAWDAVLRPRLAGRDGARALFVGPFDGRCVAWAAEHLLTGADVVVHALDGYAWRDTLAPSAPALATGEAYERCVFHRGVPTRAPRDLRAALLGLARRLPRRVRLVSHSADSHATGLLALRGQGQGQSQAQAQALPQFDLVYIDARSSRHVMEAAVLAFPLLRPGAPGDAGVMVITNNTHGRTHDASCPRRGIDGFLDAYAAELKVVRNGFHLFLERRAQPLDLGPCRSEYFDGVEDRAPPRCESTPSGRRAGAGASRTRAGAGAGARATTNVKKATTKSKATVKKATAKTTKAS